MIITVIFVNILIAVAATENKYLIDDKGCWLSDYEGHVYYDSDLDSMKLVLDGCVLTIKDYKDVWSKQPAAQYYNSSSNIPVNWPKHSLEVPKAIIVRITPSKPQS